MMKKLLALLTALCLFLTFATTCLTEEENQVDVTLEGYMEAGGRLYVTWTDDAYETSGLGLIGTPGQTIGDVLQNNGVLSVEPSDPTMGGNIWYIVNGVNHYSTAPDSVSAGDVVILNIWGGFEGTATLTAGGGGGNESAPMIGENVAVGEDETLEITYTDRKSVV